MTGDLSDIFDLNSFIFSFVPKYSYDTITDCIYYCDSMQIIPTIVSIIGSNVGVILRITVFLERLDIFDRDFRQNLRICCVRIRYAACKA